MVTEWTLVRFFNVIIRLHYKEIACVITVRQCHFLMPLSLLDFLIKAVAEAPAEFRWHHVCFVGHRLLGLVFILWWTGFEPITLRFIARFHLLFFLLLKLPLLYLLNRGVRYYFINVQPSLLQVHRILLELEAFLPDPSGQEAPVTD